MEKKWFLVDGNNPMPVKYSENKPIEIKFDNGEIRDFSDEWPFAIATHWRYKYKAYTFDEIVNAGLYIIEPDGNLLNEEMLIKKLNECRK